MIRCDQEWQDLVRCDKRLGVLGLILKLLNENSFASNLVDKVC